MVDDLLSAFTDEARRRGHREADLVVDADNGAARRCYLRNGWYLVHEPGRADGSARYHIDLTSTRHADQR